MLKGKEIIFLSIFVAFWKENQVLFPLIKLCVKKNTLKGKTSIKTTESFMQQCLTYIS